MRTRQGDGGERKLPVVPPPHVRRHSRTRRQVPPTQLAQRVTLLTHVCHRPGGVRSQQHKDFSFLSFFFLILLAHLSPVRQSRCEETDRHVHLLPLPKCALYLEIFHMSYVHLITANCRFGCWLASANLRREVPGSKRIHLLIK